MSLNDTFVESSYPVALTAHTSDSSHAWANWTQIGGSTFAVAGAHAVTNQSSTGPTVAISSYAPALPYRATASVTLGSSSTGHEIGVVVQASGDPANPSGQNFYIWQASPAEGQEYLLQRYTNGVPATLYTVSHTFAEGDSAVLGLEVDVSGLDVTLTPYLGSLAQTPYTDTAPGTAFTSPGLVGFRSYSPSSASATTGTRITGITAGPPVTGPTSITLSGANSGNAGTASGTITATLDQPAPTGGTAIALTVATISGTFTSTPFTIAAGQTSGSFNFTPTSAGTGVITAASSGLTSGTLTYTASTPVVAPSPPTNLVLTPGNNSLSLNWTTSAGAASYPIYVGSTTGGESGTPVASPASPPYVITGLTNGVPAFVRMKAANSVGSSAYSAEVTATPAGPIPFDPSRFTAYTDTLDAGPGLGSRVSFRIGTLDSSLNLTYGSILTSVVDLGLGSYAFITPISTLGVLQVLVDGEPVGAEWVEPTPSLAQIVAAVLALLQAGVKLTSDGLDLVMIESGINARQALSPIAALAGGLLSGAGSGAATLVFKALGAASNGPTRIVANLDGQGNRPSVTLNLPE